MLDWKKVIADAKELLDLGAITSEEFELAKKEAIELRTKMTNPEAHLNRPATTTLPPSSLSSMGTMIGSPEMLDGINTMGTSIHQSLITKVGSYLLMGEIGKGGMGTVYRARHSIDAFADKVGDVVVKLMHPEFAKNPDFVQRFIGEAALGRTLTHPNFVTIHDIVSDSDNQTLAIVMDLVEGRPLEDIIPEKGMSFEEALPIIEQLSLALDYMHEQGVLHRDLKPENIIIQPDGTPVILDMGIAKDTTESDLSQTSTGMAMGTPLYMAPEQLDAKNATSAVDRFAFGLIVYQMLSGVFPWEDGLGQGEILAKKFSGNLKPLECDSKALSNAVMGLLRANAGDRTESCKVFLEQLKRSPQETEHSNLPTESNLDLTLEKPHSSQTVSLHKPEPLGASTDHQSAGVTSVQLTQSSLVEHKQSVGSEVVQGVRTQSKQSNTSDIHSTTKTGFNESKQVTETSSNASGNGMLMVALALVILCAVGVFLYTPTATEIEPEEIELQAAGSSTKAAPIPITPVLSVDSEPTPTLQSLRTSDEYEVVWDENESVWVICLAAIQSKSKAQSAVDKHKRNGVDAHVLWIPDFASTSGAEFYLVYIGPFEYEGSNRKNIKRQLKDVQRSVYGKAYAIRLDQNPKEERIK